MKSRKGSVGIAFLVLLVTLAVLQSINADLVKPLPTDHPFLQTGATTTHNIVIGGEFDDPCGFDN